MTALRCPRCHNGVLVYDAISRKWIRAEAIADVLKTSCAGCEDEDTKGTCGWSGTVAECLREDTET